MKKLQCPKCKANLKLDIGYTGCDWDTVKGEKSGYGWAVSLVCWECGVMFTIGHVKEYNDFAEMKDELKCVE